MSINNDHKIEASVEDFSNATTSMTRLNELSLGDTISTSGKQFIESPDLDELADKVIDDHSIELGPAAVCYMLVYPNITKKRAAKVKKCSKELKFFSGYDYLVQISGELWDMLDDDTRYKMVWNQLLHLNPSYKAAKQEWVMKTRKPTYTDFYEISETQGNDWHKTVQATMSSLEDLDPENEGQVSLF